jgi:hypothetical protein
MKKVFSIALLIAIFAVSFSCKKDSETSTNPSFSAKVDGVLWNSTSIVAVHFTAANTTQIMAAKLQSSEQIELFYRGLGTGTYTCNDENSGAGMIGSINFFSDDSGSAENTIIVTKYDATAKKVSGTFSFKAEDMDGNIHNITEGKFENIPLTVQ